jgi:aryl-alcohol dehydrogenase-like predicted oxidoreductase
LTRWKSRPAITTPIAQAALNYLLRKPGVSSVLIGATSPEQLADNLKAVEWELTAEEMKTLDELSAPARPYPHWMLNFTLQDRTSREGLLT